MSRTSFSEGYQEALDDLASAYRTGGLAGLLTWAADNARDDTTRATFTTAAEANPAPSLTTAALDDLAVGARVLHRDGWTTITGIASGGWAGWRVVTLEGETHPLHVTLSQRFTVERKP